jgi:hypothetical protein
VDLAYLFFGYDFLFDFCVEHAYELAFDKYLCERIFARWMLAQVLESRDIEGEIMVSKGSAIYFFLLWQVRKVKKLF